MLSCWFSFPYPRGDAFLMKVHEYQARELLEQAGVPTPPARVAESAAEARRAFEQLTREGASLCVVKAQVHAGGRGKAGGVRLVRSADQAQDAAADILGNPLVTHQTGPEGVRVRKLMVAAGAEIEKEYYLAMTLDRAAGCPSLIASAEGGMEIEQVAEEKPEALIRKRMHPLMGLQPYQARDVAFTLGFTGKQVRQAVRIMMRLAELFKSRDAQLVEINPLITTAADSQNPDGRVLALDAKVSFDDNALFRHKDIAAMADPAEENPAERRAREHGLSYVKLDGNIGCLVNGAGLAMATMDIIKHHGAQPANFLDVGGGADEQAVAEAFSIILEDQAVKGVLVNIFGGIMQCDKIARAIAAAAKSVGFQVPLVVRLEGTNVEPAREILDEARSSIPTLRTATDLADAAEQVTQAVQSAAA